MGENRPARPARPSASRRAPRQVRAQQTVDALLQAATELFDADGVDGATTDRIAARAGVSVGSLYQYFPNKHALLDAVGERVYGEVEVAYARLWAELAGQPSLERGLDAIVDLLVAVHDGPRRLRCLLFQQRPPPVHQLERLLGETLASIEAWLVGRVARPRAVALILHRALSTLVHQFVLHPTDVLPPADAIDEVRRLGRAYLASAVSRADPADAAATAPRPSDP